MNKALTIRQWRNLNEWSQKEFADKIGVSVSTFALKENGVRDWTATELVLIKNILDISVDDIILNYNLN